MANIKSAKKRILVNRTKAARNKSIRSAVKTSIKKVEAAVQENNKAAAQAALTEAISTISKATGNPRFVWLCWMRHFPRWTRSEVRSACIMQDSLGFSL